MSTISTFILIAGLAATALFVIGFLRGLNNAIRSRHETKSTEVVDERSHLLTAGFAVVASAAVIAAIGIWPEAIYIGPLLCLFTAAAVGVAFFLERPSQAD